MLIVPCRLLHISEGSLELFVIAGQKKLDGVTMANEENPI